MAGNPSPVQCKRKPTTSGFSNFNTATDNNISRRIALASITLAVQFCLADHTITVQSATFNWIYGELLNITNTLEVLVKGRKHDPEVWWKVKRIGEGLLPLSVDQKPNRSERYCSTASGSSGWCTLWPANRIARNVAVSIDSMTFDTSIVTPLAILVAITM